MSQTNGFVKTAAWLLIITSVIGMPIGVITQWNPSIADPKGAPFYWVGAVLVVLHVLELVGVLGFWASGASGSGWLARIGLTLATLGSFTILIAEAVLRFSFDTGNSLFGAAVPLTGVGFILAGIAVLRSKQWTGWHKFVPLVTGLYPFLILLPAFALSGGVNFLAIGGWALCRLALGITMAQTNERQVPARQSGTLQSVAQN